jgi:hypothetical protein
MFREHVCRAPEPRFVSGERRLGAAGKMMLEKCLGGLFGSGAMLDNGERSFYMQ